MEFKQYNEQIARFLNTPSSETLVQNTDIIHAIFGLNDEFIEFMQACRENKSKEHRVKEAGDILFYASILSRKFRLENINRVTTFNEPQFDTLARCVQEITSMFKKNIFYGNDTHPIVLKDLQLYLSVMIHHICIFAEESFENILERNYQKLSNRYPSGEFNAQHVLYKNEDNE